MIVPLEGTGHIALLGEVKKKKMIDFIIILIIHFLFLIVYFSCVIDNRNCGSRGFFLFFIFQKNSLFSHKIFVRNASLLFLAPHHRS